MRARDGASAPFVRAVALALALPLATTASACKDGGAAPTLSAEAPAGSAANAASPGTPDSSASRASNAKEAAESPPPEPSGPPIVALDGTTTLPPPPPEGSPRLASIAMKTDVHARPDPGSPRVGYLRAGAIVEMAPAPQGTAGCSGGWRRIQPYGFVCLGKEATLDLEHPIVRATARRPDPTQKLPYMYGIVTRGGPAYARLPTAEHLERYEPNLKKHLARWAKDEESGATYGLDLWFKWKKGPMIPALDALAEAVTDPDIPPLLRDGGLVPNLSGLVTSRDAVKIDEVSRRNGVAFIDSFLFQGRRYNLTTDLRVVPADRFRPIRGSDFHGVRIGVDVDFPFALVRKKGAKKWTWSASKKRMIEAGDLPWRSAVALTGKQRFAGGVLHYEAKEGFWVDDRHAGRIDPAKRMPAWGKNGEKWIDVNITKQVLVAYEGTKAVYATLVSSGESGLGDPETSRATKRGIFRIHTKFVTTTMDSDAVGEEFELRDVPYVQYFEDGYALHGAYWHDAFGQPKSHGCLNLSPEDARRLFYWTEPRLPPGWHGVARPLTGTVVFIHP